MGVTGMLGARGLLLAALVAAPQQADVDDRLYGRVVTQGGAVYTGFIRWDLNEGSWADLLNGSKQLPVENFEEAERLRGETRRENRRNDRTIEFLGIRVSWDEDDDGDFPEQAESGIRFGHLSSLTVLDDRSALLVLRSGLEVELSGGSTDIGSDLRGVTVDDPERGEVELRWRDLDAIEFMAAPPGATPRSRRLHGTLRDRWGNAYTGYVSWDVDEIYTTDVLDGEEDGRSRKIPFDRIAAIERAGSSGARVTLTSGEEITLRGTNDVDSSNRGIQVSDPGLGQVQVAWDEFEDVRFHAPDRPTGYDSFGGGERLQGTVLTEGGDRYSGFIRWDNDEEFAWELLDGEYRDVVFDIEFGKIERIRKRSSRSAMVTLRDGRTFELDGSNDVNRQNKGVLVDTEEGLVLVEWDEFREVTFERR